MGDQYGNTLNGFVKGGIRLSYSKNPLGVRTPTNTANGSGLHQPFGSGDFSSLQEAFARHSHTTNPSNILSIDTSLRAAISRRDTVAGGGEVTSPSQYFASSPPPPPRFFSPPPSTSSGFGPAPGSGTGMGVGMGRSGQGGFTGSFSPFGSSTPPETSVPPIPQQAGAAAAAVGATSSVQDGTEPFNTPADQSTTPNLENTRG